MITILKTPLAGHRSIYIDHHNLLKLHQLLYKAPLNIERATMTFQPESEVRAQSSDHTGTSRCAIDQRLPAGHGPQLNRSKRDVRSGQLTTLKPWPAL